ALAKDPAQRYQSGREMANDLEKCRENTGKAVKQPEPTKGIVLPDKGKAAAAKFAAPAQQRPAAPPSAPKFESKPPEPRFTEPAPSQSKELETPWTMPAPPPSKPEAPKAAAAAAGWNSAGS